MTPPLSSVDPTAPGAVSYLAHHIIVFLVAGIASFLLFRLWDSCTGKESPSALRWRSRLSRTRFFVIGAFVLALPWLCWAIAHFSGTMRDDTFAQLFQYRGAVGYYLSIAPH